MSIKYLQIDMSNRIVCDYCDKDYTDSNEHGGFLFGSYATCPKCAPRMLEKIREYREENFIKAYCPAHLSFRDWVYTLR